MSKKSKKKQIHSQLENLFDDLEQENTSIDSFAPGEASTGWTWECDQNGVYTACSNGVDSLLGIASDTFLGQLIASYALSPQSKSIVQEALQQNEERQSIQICSPSRTIRTNLPKRRFITTSRR